MKGREKTVIYALGFLSGVGVVLSTLSLYLTKKNEAAVISGAAYNVQRN